MSREFFAYFLSGLQFSFDFHGRSGPDFAKTYQFLFCLCLDVLGKVNSLMDPIVTILMPKSSRF